MKKHVLDINFDDEFLLFGIVTQEKYYRLAWLLNQELNLNFCLKEEIIIFQSNIPKAKFTRLDNHDDINKISYHLIENKDEGHFLLPEIKNIDYLLMIRGATEFILPQTLIDNIKKLQEVQLVTSIDLEKLKSKHHLFIPEY
jgi:hypothetical protein